MKNNLGFTTMELMVVIAIIGILTAISIPNVISWRADHQLNAATRNVQSTIQSIRLKAVKENAFQEIEFREADDTIVQKLRIVNPGDDDFTSRHVALRLPPGINLSSNFPGNTLRINARGIVSGQTGTVTVSNSKGISRKIVVRITGNSVIQ